ncbi:UNVERIFIED_CONTAM: hypothetical protein H355_004823 [Colinus virginianus]|nr:hypothetical protein H355_004823 [Colinus virginianus]
MSCFDLCRPCGPTPLANSCNEPCVRQCQDSRVVIQPSPVVVTLPGPILSSFPQNTAVGSSTSAAVGSILSQEGVPISSGGFGISGLGSRFSGRSSYPEAFRNEKDCHHPASLHLPLAKRFFTLKAILKPDRPCKKAGW